MKKASLLTTLVIYSFIGFSQKFHVNEDFNSGTLPLNWTNNTISGSTSWQFGIDGSTNSPGNQNLDGTSFAFFDDDDLGQNSTNNTVELLTPVFDNSSDLVTTLEFDYNFRAFTGILDSFSVDVFDGTNWVSVFSRFANDCGNYVVCNNNLPHAIIDISAYANVNCQVRFNYHDGNDWAWYIGVDNIQITSPAANDVLISKIISPISSCGLSSNESITVQIKNTGTLPASGFDIVFDIDNGSQLYMETVMTAIAPGDSLNYTYTAVANMGTIGLYSISAYTVLMNDGNASNDTINTSIRNRTIYSPTYSDDFEGTGEWIVQGTNISWELGIPTGSLINSSISGTKAYVTNLNGNYNNNEVSYLISPCFDFSLNILDPVIQFFLNYNTESGFDPLLLESSFDNGVSWQRVNASFRSSNWYNTIDGWGGNSNGWLRVENRLDGFAGQSQVLFRFTFQSDGSTNFEGVGLDDFSIYYPGDFDVNLTDLLSPSINSNSLCGLSTNSSIVVEVENSGINPLDTTILSYRIDNGTIFNDTLFTTILPDSTHTFAFKQKFNFTPSTSYSIDVWANNTRDNNSVNDSLINQIFNNNTNSPQSLPFFEDFESFTPGTGFNNVGSGMANEWTRTPSSGFFWGARNTPTSSFGTGPDIDHTPGQGVNFIYTEGFSSTSAATLESPCIDLSQAQNPILDFWSHRFGIDMPDLFIDIYNGNQWVNVSILNTTPQMSNTDPYSLNSINLSQFVGRVIKIRFRTEISAGFRSDIAIDDVLIYEPSPIDLRVNRLINPNTTGSSTCGFGIEDITVELENIGLNQIDTTILSYRVNNGTIFNDTIIAPIPPTAVETYTFRTKFDFTNFQTYNIDVWLITRGDGNNLNDSLLNQSVTNSNISSFNLPYFENFETLTPTFNVPTGWTKNSFFGYFWNFSNTSTPTPGTGPDSDHTAAPGNQFLYTDASQLNPFNSEAILETPCINLINAQGPILEFWSHRFGSDMADLFIDAFDGSQWINVSILNTTPQMASSDPYTLNSINLGAFVGKNIKLRFRTGTWTGVESDMAIDDFRIFESITTDVQANRLISPVNDCNLSETITVELENTGVTNIITPFPIVLQINNGPIIRDTVRTPLLIGDKKNFTFAFQPNFSANNTSYIIKVTTLLNNDANMANNSVVEQVDNYTQPISYVEDFQSFTDGSCSSSTTTPTNDFDVLDLGWNTATNGNSEWHVHDVGACGLGTNNTGNTGPLTDNSTLGFGKFMYVESTSSIGSIAQLTTTCIDFSNEQRAAMNFWYHAFGNQIGTLTIDIFANGVWNPIPGFSIVGQQQNAQNDPWQMASVQFDQFAGQEIRVRFNYDNTTGAGNSDFAIDDISFFVPITTGIEENKEVSILSLYPNPNDGNFNLKVSASQIGKAYQIIDAKGSIIKNAILTSPFSTIQLDNIEQGIYFLRIEGTSDTRKIVIH